ncbi:hypothetical protein LIER_27815 [Lithospermum erythrorhizon]|uniref:Uncharacterized protein n=1 Tax=Lithospermum erythrorhizon TaxID=34254 RepID=A0AAV3RHC4_LITER
MSPPVLAVPIHGKHLILYVAAEWGLCDDLPDEDVMKLEVRPSWKMYFYDMLPYSFTLSQRCSNNVEEYQALILGLEVATELDIP